MPITPSGIETAIAALNYRNPSALKSRLLNAVFRYYDGVDLPEGMGGIDSDTLIRNVWGTGDDPAGIQSRRKNFNSVKSAINADFKRAWEEGTNPEGVMLGPDNTFVMSRAAKDKMLAAISESVPSGGPLKMDQVGEALKIISEFLSSRQDMGMPTEIKQLGTLIEKLIDETRFGDLPQFDVVKRGDYQKMPDGVSKGVNNMTEDAGLESDDLDGEIAEETLSETDTLEEIELETTEQDLCDEAGAGRDEGFEAAEELIDADALEEINDVQEVQDEETGEDVDKVIEMEDDDELDVNDAEIMDDAEVGVPVGEDEYEEIEEEVIDESELVDVIDDDELLDEVEGVESDDVEIFQETQTDLTGDMEDDAVDGGEPSSPEVEVDEIVEGVDEVIDEDPDGFSEIMEDAEDAEDAEDVEDMEDAEDPVDEGMRHAGWPVDGGHDNGFDVENRAVSSERKRALVDRFDGYLGAMEKFYNQFVMVPKGEYPIGATPGDEDVLPMQRISLDEFFIAKFPVTNALFEVFVDRTGYVTTAEKLGYGTVYCGRFQKITDEKTGRSRSVWNSTCTRRKVKGAAWFQPLGPGSSLHNKRNHPVVQISAMDARSFAAWTGKRLPSEVEWEAAARTMDGRLLPWGNDRMENLCNIETSGISDTTPVDHYPKGANPLGIVDLLGNIMEWTSDSCKPKYAVNKDSVYYIAKGGGWIADNTVKLSTRHRLAADFTSNILGLRCLVD